MYAYCLFCETNRCSTIADLINRNFVCRCISPQIIQRKWIKGIPTEELHNWLPGYIFVYSEEKINLHFPISGIIRYLGNGELTGNDLKFAEMIYRRNGIMGSIILVREGDRCVVADPAWNEIQGKVVKIDSGRKRCCVEYKFDEISRTIWVGYEMIRPDSEK